VIFGFLMLALTAGFALTTWNAHKNGEMQVRGFSLLDRRENPDAFRLYLIIRIGVAGLLAVLGALEVFFLRP